MPIITTQFPASVSVTNLNGASGFTITGFPYGSFGGYSVSGVGDINNDGMADFVIGAGGASSNAGASYVLFGKSALGSSGSFDVSTLTGTNGFIVTGFPAGSEGGYSVSGAGDVNADGISDLLIGAPDAAPCSTYCVGASFIIFGSVGIGSTGSVSVASLTGTNGFAINGFPTNSLGGYTVSGIGDINNDGIADIAVAAPYASSQVGTAYIIFGKVGIGNSGSINVASLNGANGFTINGFPASGQGGFSLSRAGDINNDGIADFIVGAPSAFSQAGTSYAVFGKSGIGASGKFNVSALTGSNGFSIAFQSGSHGGISVSGGGDINGDGISDLVIGAPYATSSNGACYVVFGKSGIGSSGSLNVLGLTGSNGFAITNFPTGGQGGYSVTMTGDFNGDGIADLGIGAPGVSSTSGLSYVVFGKSGIGSSGSINILNLNGVNGFTINGFPATSEGGYSISLAGDVNHDGITDLCIGAPGTSSNSGISYLFFGDGLTNLLINSLTITVGQTQTISSSNLNATSLKFPNRNGALVFSVSNLQHGIFQQINQPGVAIASFTQSQVASGEIQFVQDASVLAPSYAVKVSDGGLATLLFPQPANITWIHRGPKLVTNTLAINQGQTMILTSATLNAVDQDYPPLNPNLLFAVSGVHNGRFEFSFYPGQAITRFMQGQIQSASVLFVHDGSVSPPGYFVTVSDGGITTAPQAPIVDFDLIPLLVNNSLSINQGQTTLLTSANFAATDPYDIAANLVFTESNVEHGHFEEVTNPGTVILSFTQGQVQSGDIQFVPDGSTNAPSLSIAVTDGRATSTYQATTIDFNLAPVLNNNQLTIKQGGTVVLTTANLSATDPDDVAGSLLFIVSQVQHGHFEDVNKLGVAITSFNQAQVQNEEIQFVQDGTSHVPSYNVAVSDGKMTTIAQTSTITFDAAPVLTGNQLTITQGETVFVTPSDLSATDDSTAASNLVFTASAITHGHFEDSDDEGVAISQFSQQRIFSGALKFIADGSTSAPSYNISVSDGILTTSPSPAIVNFALSSVVVLSSDTIRNAIIGSVVSGTIGLLFLFAKLTISYKTNKYLNKILQGPSGGHIEKTRKFQQAVIRPIADKIFERIGTTWFLGYRSQRDARAYISAIELIVSNLVDYGVDLDLDKLSAQKQARIFNEVARQTKQINVPDYGICSTAYLCSFFRPEVTPKQLEDSASDIAWAVVTALSAGKKNSARTPNSSATLSDVELQQVRSPDSKSASHPEQSERDVAARLSTLEKGLKKFDKRIGKIEQSLLAKQQSASDAEADANAENAQAFGR